MKRVLGAHQASQSQYNNIPRQIVYRIYVSVYNPHPDLTQMSLHTLLDILKADFNFLHTLH